MFAVQELHKYLGKNRLMKKARKADKIKVIVVNVSRKNAHEMIDDVITWNGDEDTGDDSDNHIVIDQIGSRSNESEHEIDRIEPVGSC